MNQSQIILTIGAFFILGTIMLMVNNSTLESLDKKFESKNLFYLINEANNLFEEIQTKSFDEKITSLTNLIRDSLTHPLNFGPDGELYPFYDDIDDYNNYSTTITTPDNKSFRLNVSVKYVNESAPEQTSTTQTFFKFVQIQCVGQQQNKLFELKQIISIW